jgi:hypothetical protein
MAVSIGFGGSFFKSRELRAVIGDENGEQTRYGGCGGAEAHDRSNCAPTKETPSCSTRAEPPGGSEDLTGQGHTSRSVGGDRLTAIVPLAD